MGKPASLILRMRSGISNVLAGLDDFSYDVFLEDIDSHADREVINRLFDVFFQLLVSPLFNYAKIDLSLRGKSPIVAAPPRSL